MRKIFLLVLLSVSLATYAQKKDLTTVNTVKPKLGQKMAWEAAWKIHVAKFHKDDQKSNVYEILSGEYVGSYHLTNGGRAFEDFDKERADAAAHSLDLDKNFFPMLESTRNGVYRFVDSLSLRPEVEGDKFVVTVRHLKMDLNMGNYYREIARAAHVNGMLKDPTWQTVSVRFFDQQWDGSDQTTVSIRVLKDGFKSLEPGYYGPMGPTGNPMFREEYTKMYGAAAWDERVKVLEGAVVKTEQYIMKYRKDLSSQ